MAILALFSGGAALVARTNFADPGRMDNVMKNRAMAGGFPLFVR